MTPYKGEVTVVVPHRISGFFEIVDEIDGNKINNPERIGSRGAGFNLSAVGRTEIKIEELDRSNGREINIFINNEKMDEKAETTYYIFNYVKKYIENSVKITILHEFDLPVGCGFGASGSGALGTIYGLEHDQNLGLSIKERGIIAHVAEDLNITT